MIHVAAKWTHAFNQYRVLVQSSLQKMSGQGVRTHPPMVLSAMVLIYSDRSSASLFNGGETFWLVMMPLGGGRAIITLRAADRDRGRHRGVEIVEVTCHHFVLSLCGSPDRERATCPSLGSRNGVAPDNKACHVTFALIEPRGAEAKKNKSIYDEPPSLGFPAACLFNNGAGSRVSASNTRVVTVTALRSSSPFCQFTLGFRCPRAFCGLPILVYSRAKGWDGDLAPFSKCLRTRTLFSLVRSGRAAKMRPERSMWKNRGQAECEGVLRTFCIRMAYPFTCGQRGRDNRENSSTSSGSPTYIHPNMVRVLMGCSILSILFNLDLSLLEGAARGHVLVKGLWAGLLKGEVGRVGGESLVQSVSRLFEIAARGARRLGMQSTSQRAGGKWREGTLEGPGDKRSSSSSPLAPRKKKISSKENGWLFRPRKQPRCIGRVLPPNAAGGFRIFFETIEVSCSSAQEDHPEESEMEMAEENPTDPVLVPDEACTSASPFSYAELGEMLKRIPSDSDTAAVSDHMKTFVSRCMSGEEECA
ncbi:hypothetical protein AAG906_021688 [Vitis piasezkii]